MSKYKVAKVNPYNYSAYMGSSSYNIQNMLLRQIEFPYEYNPNDYINSVYNDRLPHDTYQKKLDKLKINGGGLESWITSANPDILLDFMRDVFDNKKITGCRIVRYSNAGGYPILRFDVYIKTNKKVKTYNDHQGPSIEWPEANEMQMDENGNRFYVYNPFGN